MLVERSPVARMECDHGHRDRISLVLEKQRQVVRFDIPQLDLCLHRGLLHSMNFGTDIAKTKETPGVPKLSIVSRFRPRQPLLLWRRRLRCMLRLTRLKAPTALLLLTGHSSHVTAEYA